MNQEHDWKKFEHTGAVTDYLNYKQSSSIKKGSTNAAHHTGACLKSDKNRGS